MRAHRVGVLACVLASGTDAFAEAEHYQNVRVDAGMTFSSSSVSERKGTGFAVEIKGMANDNIAIGGRIELAVMWGGIVGDDRAPMDVAMAASGIFKGEYLFGDSFVRPFVGFGVGGYTIGAQTIDSGPNHTGISHGGGRYIGVAPQIGVDIGRVRLVATYNAIVGAYLELHETIGTVDRTVEISQNYLSLEVSFQFAGGRKPVSSPPRIAPPAPITPAGSPGAGF